MERDFARRFEPAIGVARVPRPANVVTTQVQTVGYKLPSRPPEWVDQGLEVVGSASPQKNKLTTARAADASAQGKIRERILQLKIDGQTTVGDLAQKDRHVQAAVDRAVSMSRPYKTNYKSDLSVEVYYQTDLHDLWRELRR